MDILEKSLKMLKEHSLCDHCLGRQFAALGYDMENDDRGRTIKSMLTLKSHALTLSKNREGKEILKILATNGFSKTATEILKKIGKQIPLKSFPEKCFLCENTFNNIDVLAKTSLKNLQDYEYNSFLVGIELPVSVEEREDEFKAKFSVDYSENLRNEFGRVIGKKIVQYSGKVADYKKPEVVVLVNPFGMQVRLQINPLFVAGKYRKLVRGIPQSKWYCSSCRGKGCEKCDWTGKMYPESVEELISKPMLEASGGTDVFFHASGREDIDARMLGSGRPFVIEIAQPRERSLNLKRMEKIVNEHAQGKVEISNLRFADKSFVRKLKKGESSQKEYHVILEFENEVNNKDMHLVEQKLTNTLIKQKTPLRVLHRRADLTREKYIYEVKVKKLSPKKAEMKIRCQGGLYVKELVTSDEGRTTPSVSEILQNKAKPVKLDVLNVIMVV